MNRVPRVLVSLATVAILLSLFSRAALAAETPSLQFSYKRFGEVTVYPAESSRHLALFISGDGGWNRGVVDMARSLAGLDATVVGINIRRYERAIAAADDECTDAVSDFTGLAKAVEEKLGLTHQIGIALALNRLLRPASIVPRLPGEVDLQRAAVLAAEAPRSDAHLALVGDKELLWNEARTAFLMYDVQGRSWVSMGDPVGPEADRIELGWRFRELAERHGGWAVFYQVSQQNLPLFIDLGLSFLKLGEEARVPLAGFDLASPARKKQRYAVRKLEETGCRFEIRPASAVPELLPQLKEISDEWLTTKKVREKGFSLGNFKESYLCRTPVALVSQGDRLVAFANLWPGKPGGEISIDLMRHTLDAPPGVMDYLFTKLMVWGREQGYAWFSLGMAPFSGLDPRELSPLTAKLGTYLFRHGESFYNFQGLRQFKEKFDPVWEPRYLASPGRLVLPRVLADLVVLISSSVRGSFGK